MNIPKLVDEGMKAEAERLAQNCLLYDEFMVREMEAGRISSDQFEDNGGRYGCMAIVIRRLLWALRRLHK